MVADTLEDEISELDLFDFFKELDRLIKALSVALVIGEVISISILFMQIHIMYFPGAMSIVIKSEIGVLFLAKSAILEGVGGFFPFTCDRCIYIVVISAE